MAGGNAVELATAYISLIPETSKIAPGVKKALGGVDIEAGKSGQSMGDKLASGMGKALKLGAKTAGVGAAAALSGALVGGFKRLDAIDQAKAKFAGLGKTAQEQASIMDDVTKSVKGTSFATNEAADAAAMFLAAGIKPGEQLTGVLKTVGDSAAFANKSFAEVAPIFTKAKNSGKVMGDTLAQLGDNSIPAVTALATHLGKTTDEINKMASEGKISFEDLQAAMDETIGGQALKSGETFSGAMDNAKAAMSRLGASILEPGFKAAPGILGGITDGIDALTGKVGPVAEEWAGKLGGALKDFSKKAAPEASDWMHVIGDGAQDIAGAAKAAAPVVKTLGSALTKVPWEVYAAGIAVAVGNHTGLIDKLDKGTASIKQWATGLRASQRDVMAQNEGIGSISASLQVLGQRVPAIGKMGEAFRASSTDLRLAGMETRATGTEMGGLSGALRTAGGAMQSFGGVAKGLASGGMSLVKSGAMGIMDLMGGPWGVALGIGAAAITGLANEHKKAAEEERLHKERQQELRDSLDETTGAVTAQTREIQLKRLEESGAMDTARDLGLSQTVVADAMNGNTEAIRRVTNAVNDSTVAQIEGSQFWTDYGGALEQAGFHASDMVDVLAGSDDALHRFTDAADSETIQAWQDFSGTLDDSANAALDFKAQILGAQSDINDVTTQKAQDELRALNDESDKAKQAVKLLGDAAVHLGDSPNELTVDLQGMSDGQRVDLRKELADIGVESKIEDGHLTMTFDSAAGILAELDSIDGKVHMDHNGTIDIDSNTEEVNNQLERMGVLSRDQEGHLHMEDNLRDVINRLVEANLFKVDDKTSSLVITDNAQEILDKTRRTLNSPNGDTSSQHTVYTHEELMQGAADAGQAMRASIERRKARGELHTGGIVPASASGRMIGDRRGYRLPTSGPGTDTTDGILGVDAAGTPTSWVDAGEWVINADSSAKYADLLSAINDDDTASISALASGIPGHAEGMSSAAALTITGATGDPAISDQLTAFTTMATGVQTAASTLITPALDAVGTSLAGVGQRFMDTAALQVTPAMNALGTAVAAAKTSLVDPAFAGIRAGLGSLASRFSADTATSRNVFANMGGVLANVKSGTVDPMFAGMQDGIGAVAAAFDGGTAAANAHFATIGPGTAGPARYAIGSVFNGGIVQMWNSAADYLGTNKMAPAPMAFATGGHVRGPGGPTDDKIPALLSDGEYVVNAKAVKQIGVRNLNAINDGNPVDSRAYKGNLPQLMETDATWQRIASRYAAGGPAKGSHAWKQIKRGMDWARSLNGRPYVLGGDPVGGGGTDCSGYQSSIADKIGGGAGHRQWGTMAFNGGGNSQYPSGPQGFVKGLAAGHAIGIVNGGPADGHTAGTLGGIPGLPAVNVESGGSHGNVAYGGPAVGADSSQFPTHYHLPLVGDRFVSGGGGGPSLMELVNAAISPHKAKITSLLAAWGNPSGLANSLPPKTNSSLGAKVEAKIKALAEEMDAKMGSAAGVDLGGLHGDTQQIAQQVFARHGMTGAEWEDAAWIIGRESGWDTNATNASSGAYGLGQLNPASGTLQQYEPTHSSDAGVQADATARYIKNTYGTAANARAHWEANGWYDDGGYLEPGTTVTHNETSKPEPVFTHEQWATLRAAVTKAVDVDWSDLAGSAEDIAVAGEKIAEAAEVFSNGAWAKAQDSAVQGQIDDVAGVFGFGSPSSIPLVQAAGQLSDLVEGYDPDKAREDSEAHGVTVSDEQMAQAKDLVAQLGVSAAAITAAVATPNPAAVGAAGSTVNISVDNANAAFAQFRKIQAQASTAAAGV